MRTTKTTAQRRLLWSLALLTGGLACAPRGADDGPKPTTDSEGEADTGAGAGPADGAPPPATADLADRPLAAPVDCGVREAMPPLGRPSDPVDIAEVLMFCEDDPTPDLRALDDVRVDSRAELLGLRCLCAVDGTLSIDLSSEAAGSDGALVALAGLREVDALTLQGDASAVDLRPLRRLSFLRMLTLGDLPLLETLDGLPPIAREGELHLRELPQLRALGPIGDSPSLSRLTLDQLPLLELPSLPPLVVRFGDLELRGLPGLRSLRGLESVADMHKLVLEDLPLIASLGPLGALTEVDQLVLSDLPALTSLRGLDRLTWAFRLEIVGLNGLRRLDGLGGLHEVVELVITDNADLRSFEGLAPGLVIQELRVERDPSLTRLGEAGSPAVDDLTLTDLDALVSAELHACGSVDRACEVRLTRLPQLETLPRFGSGVLRVMELQELGRLRTLAQRVRLGRGADLSLTGLDLIERLDLIAEPERAGSLSIDIDSVRLSSLPALRDLGWDSPIRSRSLSLHALGSMTDLRGLGPAPATLTIEDMPRLESLRGVDVPDDEVYTVALRRLPALRSLEGLDRLEIESALELTDLPALTDLDALTLYSRVWSVELTRTGVEHLNLPPATYNRTFELRATDNPGLRTADLDAVIDDGVVVISDSPLFEGFSTPLAVDTLRVVELRNLGALRDLEALRGLRAVEEVFLHDLPLLPAEARDWLCALATTSCVVSP